MIINEIEVFLAVESTRSFTKAAEMLHMSQPTISHHLKALEEVIGFTLFERRKGQKKIRLTSKGEAFISIAHRWNALWQETHVLQLHEPRYSLSIGSVDSLNTTVLTSLYDQLANHNPKINLKIITKTSPELYELVEKREIDVGFVLRELNASNVIVEPLFSEPMVIIKTIDNKLCKKAVHPTDLEQRHEIFLNWSPAYMAWHNRWWDPHGSCHIEVDTIHMILSHMKNPKHWAIVPMSLARSPIVTSKFNLFEITDPPPNRVCYKISHRYPYTRNALIMEVLDQYLQILMKK